MKKMIGKILQLIGRNDSRRYFDYAAATPVDPLVATVVDTYTKDFFYNESTLYREGVKVKQDLEDSRSRIAKILHTTSREVVFTSGGTESDNLALHGIIYGYTGTEKPHVITSTIEHSAVYEYVQHLVSRGICTATYIPVDTAGVIDIQAFKAALTENTVVVSLQYVNSETGTIQPIKEITRIVRAYRKQKNQSYPYVHTDAAQAPLYVPVHIDTLGVDLISLNSSKMYGPHGVGVLVVRQGIPCVPMMHGGGQEGGFRPGTVQVPLVLGFAKAVELAEMRREKDNELLTKLRLYAVEKLTNFARIKVLGVMETTTPAHIFITVEGYPSDLLVLELDAQGILVSSQSACDIDGGETSRVFEAIVGKQNTIGYGTVRITLGRRTTKEDVDALIYAFASIFKKLDSWYTVKR